MLASCHYLLSVRRTRDAGCRHLRRNDFHYVVAGLTLFALLPIFHLIAGLFMVSPQKYLMARIRHRAVWLAICLVGALFITLADVRRFVFAAGMFLAKKHYMFCLVMRAWSAFASRLNRYVF
jgi:hypothetical protein